MALSNAERKLRIAVEKMVNVQRLFAEAGEGKAHTNSTRSASEAAVSAQEAYEAARRAFDVTRAAVARDAVARDAVARDAAARDAAEAEGVAVEAEDVAVEAEARRQRRREARRQRRRALLGEMQCAEFHGDPVACNAWAEYDTNTGEFTPCKYTSGKAGGERGQCKKVEQPQRADRVRTGIVRELGLRGLPAYDAKLSGSEYYARDSVTGHLTEASIRKLWEANEAIVGGMRPEILKDAKQSTLALVEGTGWGRNLASKHYLSQEMREGLRDLSSTIATLLRQNRNGIQKVMKHAGKWRSQKAMEHYTSDEDVSADARALASAIVGRYRRAMARHDKLPTDLNNAIIAVKSDELTRATNRVRELLDLNPLK